MEIIMDYIEALAIITLLLILSTFGMLFLIIKLMKEVDKLKKNVDKLINS